MWSCHTGTRAILTFMTCLKIERVVYNGLYRSLTWWHYLSTCNANMYNGLYRFVTWWHCLSTCNDNMYNGLYRDLTWWHCSSTCNVIMKESDTALSYMMTLQIACWLAVLTLWDNNSFPLQMFIATFRQSPHSWCIYLPNIFIHKNLRTIKQHQRCM